MDKTNRKFRIVKNRIDNKYYIQYKSWILGWFYCRDTKSSKFNYDYFTSFSFYLPWISMALITSLWFILPIKIYTIVFLLFLLSITSAIYAINILIKIEESGAYNKIYEWKIEYAESKIKSFQIKAQVDKEMKERKKQERLNKIKIKKQGELEVVGFYDKTGKIVGKKLDRMKKLDRILKINNNLI